MSAVSGAWIHGPAIDTESRLWDVLEAALASEPDQLAVAVIGSDVRRTRRDLLTAAMGMSERLRAAGVRSGDIAVIACDRSYLELVAVLACVHRGATYVGIDGSLPPEQLDHLRSTLRPAVVIAEAMQELDPVWQGITRVIVSEDRSSPAVASTAGDEGLPCYISFTSGSTGRPKGVVIPRRAVCRLIAGASTYLRVGEPYSVLRAAPLSFDASTYEIFVSLARGATIHILPAGPVEIDALADAVIAGGLEGSFFTTSLFVALCDARPEMVASLRQVLIGGETVPTRTVAAALSVNPDLTITNCYGPTEATTFTTTHTVSPGDLQTPRVPIGRPVPGTSVAVGSDGELLISGPCLASGYLGLEEETARRFVEEDGVRFYRSGDRCEISPDGVVTYLERLDRQVKVNGHRIECGPIEDVIQHSGLVRSAVVLAVESPLGLAELGCVFVADLGARADTGAVQRELRETVRSRLGGLAVPTRWAAVEAMPLQVNGKTDLARASALLARSAQQVLATTHLDDTSMTTYERVRSIWRDVLGSDGFSDNDAFFDAGGDSLKIVQLHRLLQLAFPHATVRIVDLFGAPTVTAMVDYLAESGRE